MICLQYEVSRYIQKIYRASQQVELVTCNRFLQSKIMFLILFLKIFTFDKFQIILFY